MDRSAVSRFLFATAVVLMPASYVMKYFLGVLNITWIDPTLVLGALLFLICGYQALDTRTFFIVAYAFLAAWIGTWYLGIGFDREKTAQYVFYVESVRLALNFAWFWTCAKFFSTDRNFVLRWLAIAV